MPCHTLIFQKLPYSRIRTCVVSIPVFVSVQLQFFLGLAERPWKTSDARLVLEDGSIWRAKSFGASGTQVGEVVFNTSLTG